MIALAHQVVSPYGVDARPIPCNYCVLNGCAIFGIKLCVVAVQILFARKEKIKGYHQSICR